MDEAIKDGQRVALGKYDCYDREPYKTHLMVQDGWTADNRRNMVEIPFVMSMTCNTNIPGDSRCQGCKWHPEKPPEVSGTFDNRATMRREFWADGRCKHSVSMQVIEARSQHYPVLVHWGYYPDLPAREKV